MRHIWPGWIYGHRLADETQWALIVNRRVMPDEPNHFRGDSIARIIARSLPAGDYWGESLPFRLRIYKFRSVLRKVFFDKPLFRVESHNICEAWVSPVTRRCNRWKEMTTRTLDLSGSEEKFISRFETVEKRAEARLKLPTAPSITSIRSSIIRDITFARNSAPGRAIPCRLGSRKMNLIAFVREFPYKIWPCIQGQTGVGCGVTRAALFNNVRTSIIRST